MQVYTKHYTRAGTTSAKKSPAVLLLVYLYLSINLFTGMVGDVNLYWNDYDEPNTAEIEIMVAEQQSRRKGIAHEALTIFMAHAARELVRYLLKVVLFQSRDVETGRLVF